MLMLIESFQGKSLAKFYSEYAVFEKDTIFSMSLDMSWALWNTEKKELKKKIKLIEEVKLSLIFSRIAGSLFQEER